MSKDKIMYTRQMGTKTFHGNNHKDSYMSAVKWYASNILTSKKFFDITAEYIKLDDGGITLKLWVSIPEEEVMDNHCNCCKAMHSSFFINEDTHCDRCSAISFQKRLASRLGVKLSYYKELLSKRAND